MKNPLENFSLMDLVDLKDKAKKEHVNNQASKIIDKFYKCFVKDPNAKYMIYSSLSLELIYPINLKYLNENGFNVWRVSAMQNNQQVYKYFVCWDVDDFYEDVFKELLQDKTYSSYEYIKLPNCM